ncbi:MAG: hypothetical protein Q9191_003659 [Dirinaria sp. TL-2023a]
MSTPSSSIKASTIVLASVGALATGILAYAIYFDHKRRSDPEFRKALKRESRKQERAAKEEAEAQGAQQKKAIRAAVEAAWEEGYPTNVEDKEAYFMNEVGRGETLCQEALKVYPQPTDLMGIYDKTVPKPVIDILAEMIATDPTINVPPPASRGPGSDSSAVDG